MKHRYLFYTVFFLFIAGCTHHYVPNPDTFPLDSITEFSSTNTLSLINGQASSKDVLFGSNMGHEFYGNLQKWTETAITITRKELAGRGMSIVEEMPRSLTLSIDSAKATFGAWVIRGEVSLKVETGSGYVETYKGDNRSPASLYRALDGAVMRAVTEMLRDGNITDYLIK